MLQSTEGTPSAYVVSHLNQFSAPSNAQVIQSVASGIYQLRLQLRSGFTRFHQLNCIIGCVTHGWLTFCRNKQWVCIMYWYLHCDVKLPLLCCRVSLQFAGRSRWVYYSDEKFGWNYDASQIPPDWWEWTVTIHCYRPYTVHHDVILCCGVIYYSRLHHMHGAWSVCVSVGAVLKWLSWPRCHSGCRLSWVQGTMN